MAYGYGFEKISISIAFSYDFIMKDQSENPFLWYTLVPSFIIVVHRGR